jgi:glycosyltransferase involved in cell wall biosynthesis
MRILMLAQFYHPTIGGEERHVRDLAAFLAKRGHQVGVATLWREGLPEVEVDQGVQIFRMRGLMQRWPGLFVDANRTHAPSFPDPALVAALRRIIAKERIEIVHAHNWLLHSFLPLKRSDGPRLVVTLHDLSLVCATKAALYHGESCSGPRPLKCSGCASRHYGALKGAVTLATNSISGWFERRLVDRFLAVSDAIAVGSGLPGGPTAFEIAPNFVRDDVATLKGPADERLEELPKEPFILFVGDLRRVKGVEVLLAAYAQLDDVPPLVLIGRKCHDAPSVWPQNVYVFHDWPHAAVMQAWSRSIAGVVPSIWPEPCATVLMEAMASGKPVIASDIGGNPEIVGHNVSGLLVQPGDQLGFAHAIKTLATDENLRRRLSEGALRRVKAFTASNVVPRIEAIYQDLLAPKHTAGATVESGGFESASPNRIHFDHDFRVRDVWDSDAR